MSIWKLFFLCQIKCRSFNAKGEADIHLTSRGGAYWLLFHHCFSMQTFSSHRSSAVVLLMTAVSPLIPPLIGFVVYSCNSRINNFMQILAIPCPFPNCTNAMCCEMYCVGYWRCLWKQWRFLIFHLLPLMCLALMFHIAVVLNPLLVLILSCLFLCEYVPCINVSHRVVLMVSLVSMLMWCLGFIINLLFWWPTTLFVSLSSASPQKLKITPLPISSTFSPVLSPLFPPSSSPFAVLYDDDNDSLYRPNDST